jgi:hypothetical protein
MYEELPKRPAVDAATLTAIQELDWQDAACHNARDFERAAALITDELLSRSMFFADLEMVECGGAHHRMGGRAMSQAFVRPFSCRMDRPPRWCTSATD